MLKNIEALPGLVRFFTDNPQLCVVRFEELIGSGAGGNSSRQDEMMGDVAQFITGLWYTPTLRKCSQNREGGMELSTIRKLEDGANTSHRRLRRHSKAPFGSEPLANSDTTIGDDHAERTLVRALQ